MTIASLVTSARNTKHSSTAMMHAAGLVVSITLLVLLPSLVGWSSAAAQVPLPPAPGDPPGLSQELLARAASPNPADRESALLELVAANTARAQSLILVMLQRDYDPRVRAAAARALAATRNPDYAVMLKYASQADADAGVRAAAAAAYQALWPYGKRIKLATGLSAVCPGCGYFYLQQSKRALAYIFSAATLLGTVLALYENNPTIPGPPGGRSIRLKDDDDPLMLPLTLAAQNLWFYGIFATYRDARLMHGDAGYRYPVSREGLAELAAAPFNPHVLKSPWVWGGVPALLAAAYGFTRLVTPGDLHGMRSLSDGGGVNFLGKHYGTRTGFVLGEAYFGSMFASVGVGEEALFRGVIQAGLSETSLGLWGGWLAASIIFGGVHVTNFLNGETGFKTAALAVPYLMATGSYLGYVYIRRNFTLATGTAIHFWYDFLLSTAAFIVDPDHQEFVVQHAIMF